MLPMWLDGCARDVCWSEAGDLLFLVTDTDVVLYKSSVEESFPVSVAPGPFGSILLSCTPSAHQPILAVGTDTHLLLLDVSSPENVQIRWNIDLAAAACLHNLSLVVSHEAIDLCFSPVDSSTLSAITAGGTLWKIDVAQGTVLGCLRVGPAAAAICPASATHVALFSLAGTVSIYDRDMREAMRISLPPASTRSCGFVCGAVHPAASHLMAAGTESGELVLFDSRHSCISSRLQISAPPSAASLSASTSSVSHVAFRKASSAAIWLSTGSSMLEVPFSSVSFIAPGNAAIPRFEIPHANASAQIDGFSVDAADTRAALIDDCCRLYLVDLVGNQQQQ